MQYLDALKHIFVGEAAQRLYAPIPSQQVYPPIPEGVFEPDAAYLRIWLNDMYLAHRRVLYQTRCPMVHAYCRFLYHGKVEEMTLIASPNQIEGLTAATDRVLNLNYPMIGPLPFRGGDVEMLMALFAIEAAEYGSHLLDVLGSLSELTARGEFKVALRFLKPLKNGVEKLFGMKKVKPHLGVHDTFAAGKSAPNPLCSGYRVVIDETGSNLDPDQLWVKNGRLHVGPKLETATPFEGADYFLFFIEKIDQRDDFSSLTSIHDTWDDTIAKAWRSSDEELELVFNAFKGNVLESPDLIWSDQVRLIEMLARRIKEIRRLRNRRQFTTTLETSIEASMEQALSIGEAGEMEPSQVLRLSWK